MTIELSLLISMGVILVAAVTFLIRQEGRIKLLWMELDHMKNGETVCKMEVARKLELIQKKDDTWREDIQEFRKEMMLMNERLTEISTTLKLKIEGL